MKFENIGDLVNQINSALGEFCNEFGRIRKEMVGLQRLPKRGILFTYDQSSNKDWAINEGGGTEVQYHIAFNESDLHIRYGIGFDTQYVPYANQMSMIEFMQPYMIGFLKNEQKIRKILPNYDYVYGNIEQLRNPQLEQYTLFGNKVKTEKQENYYFIEDVVFQNILTDLNNQFEAYQIIFSEKKNFKKVTMNIQISIDILTTKGQIILQGPPGTGKTYTAKNLAEKILFDTITVDKSKQMQKLEEAEQFKLIQFHPSYSYEDFVRGIVVNTDNSMTPEYKTVNKTLAEFAKKANESNLSGGIDDFERAWNELVEDIVYGKVKKIGSSDVEVDINSQGNIRFNYPVVTYEKTYELYKFGKTDLKYKNYNKIVLNFLKDNEGKYKMKDFEPPKSVRSNKPFVLIIDEINRANLPVVLGELIYALEYRGEKVESMYATAEEGYTLILPPNLYIIGTMNTSDRSVGHIDYAIRRRFAFVDVLPAILPHENFQLELFKKVSELFIANFGEYANDNSIELRSSEHLSQEFRPEDVWLGHSYFIKGEGDFSLRKKYEIVPILKEYVKDGILKQSAEPIINAL